LKAIEKADNETYRRINYLISDNTLDKNLKIKEMTNIYNKLKISEATQDVINEYYKKAFAYLEAVNISDNLRKTELKLLVEKLFNRKK
jgi:geranylgeranyl pyrophosphate synthase